MLSKNKRRQQKCEKIAFPQKIWGNDRNNFLKKIILAQFYRVILKTRIMVGLIDQMEDQGWVYGLNPGPKVVWSTRTKTKGGLMDQINGPSVVWWKKWLNWLLQVPLNILCNLHTHANLSIAAVRVPSDCIEKVKLSIK